MPAFFRFPHTPHVAWLGARVPRDDKLLSPQEVDELLADEVVIEEKIDGANLGLSLAEDGTVRAQNRGNYLSEPFTGQFSRLSSWLALHRHALTDNLTNTLILFGEWCAARHSLSYESLPDLFLIFDVYDRTSGHFWSTPRRNAFVETLGLTTVPKIMYGATSLAELRTLLNTSTSRYRAGPPEGIVIRRDSKDWCEARAKLVREEFTQSIDEHWRTRTIQWNRVMPHHARSQ